LLRFLSSVWLPVFMLSGKLSFVSGDISLCTFRWKIDDLVFFRWSNDPNFERWPGHQKQKDVNKLQSLIIIFIMVRSLDLNATKLYLLEQIIFHDVITLVTNCSILLLPKHFLLWHIHNIQYCDVRDANIEAFNTFRELFDNLAIQIACIKRTRYLDNTWILKENVACSR